MFHPPVVQAESVTATTAGHPRDSGGDAAAVMSRAEAYQLRTRLHTARDQRQVRKLLKEGADPDALDDSGSAPIHVYVVRKGKKASECLVTLLVHSRRCDLDQPNSEGKTALHIAVERNDIFSTKVLLAFGAEVNCLTPNEFTPVDIAQERLDFNSNLLTLLVGVGGQTHEPVINNHLLPFLELANPDLLKEEEGATAADEWSGVGGASRPVNQLKPGSFEVEKGVFDSSEVESSAEKQADERRGKQKVRFATPDQSVTMGFSILTLRKVQPFIKDLEDVDSAESSMHSWIHVPGETPGDSSVDISPLPSLPESPKVKHKSLPEASARSRPKKLSLEKSTSMGRPLADYIHTDGSRYPDLAKRSHDARRRGTDLTRSGDHSYAAWQQYRELRRARMEEGKCRGSLNPGDNVPMLPTPTTSLRTDFERSVRARSPVSPTRRPCSPRHLDNANIEEVDSVVLSSPVRVKSPMFDTAPVAFRAKNGDRILCLDGGGIKGLVQIEILMQLEEATGKRVTELFDWIVGTSTGGVLALGMVYAKLSLDDLRQLYFDMKDQVFKKPTFGYRCDTPALERLFKERLGEARRMSDECKPKVMITAVNKRTTDLKVVWFNNCFSDEPYSTELIWKVARSTSAAPIFFTEFEGFVDGGVKANNPCEHALTRIQEYLDDQRRKVGCMVSVGCGQYPPTDIGDTDVMRVGNPLELFNVPSFFKRAKDLLTLLVSSMNQDEETARNCKSRCERQNIPFYRLSPFLDRAVMPTENDSEVLCEIILKAKSLLHAYDVQMGELIQLLYHFTLEHEG